MCWLYVRAVIPILFPLLYQLNFDLPGVPQKYPLMCILPVGLWCHDFSQVPPVDRPSIPRGPVSLVGNHCVKMDLCVQIVTKCTFLLCIYVTLILENRPDICPQHISESILSSRAETKLSIHHPD